MVSLPRNRQWLLPADLGLDNQYRTYPFRYDDAAGEGQVVYVLGEGDIWKSHQIFSQARRDDRLHTIMEDPGIHPRTGTIDNSRFEHGTQVTAMIIGDEIGVCRKCSVVFYKSVYGRPSIYENIAHLGMVLDHTVENSLQGKAVVNMSWGISGSINANILDTLAHMLKELETKTKTVIVAASGNDGDKKVVGKIEDYPARFGARSPRNPHETLSNILVVGAVDRNGRMSAFAETDDYITTFAPGQGLVLPDDATTGMGPGVDGTSFAAPIVAGVAAYLRSLQGPYTAQLRDPKNVKKMIQLLHRPIREYRGNPAGTVVPVVWNGQQLDFSCVADNNLDPLGDHTDLCPDIDNTLDNVKSPGDWAPGGGGGSKGINWSDGPDFPKCSSGTCGGELSRGWYCTPNPRGPPPGFKDPKDPNNAGGPNVGVGPGHNTGGGGGGMESSLNWALQMYPDGPSGTCGTQFPPDATTGHGGHLTQPCERLPQSFDVRKASGFAKGDMKICLYTSTDCNWRSNDDIFEVSGGVGLDSWSGCGSPASGGRMNSFKVTQGRCTSDGPPKPSTEEEEASARLGSLWGITWRENCGPAKSFSFDNWDVSWGCQKAPSSYNSFTAHTNEDMRVMLCFYPNENCDISGNYFSYYGDTWADHPNGIDCERDPVKSYKAVFFERGNPGVFACYP